MCEKSAFRLGIAAGIAVGAAVVVLGATRVEQGAAAAGQGASAVEHGAAAAGQGASAVGMGTQPGGHGAPAVSGMLSGPRADRGVRALDFERIATYGGSYTGIVVSGTVAFATRGHAFEVIDVIDPEAPHVIGTGLPLRAAAVVEAAASGRAYLVERYRGGEDRDAWYDQLHVVDVGDIAAPKVVGAVRLPRHSLGDVVARGTLVLSAAGSAGLTVVDATDPSRPRLAGTVDLGASITGIAALGEDHLAAGATDAQGVGWLFVLRAADPLSPVIVGREAVGAGTGKVAVTGTYVFVESAQPAGDRMYEGGTRIVDLADYSNPRAVGLLRISEVIGFAAAGDRVYALEAPHGVRDRYHLWSIDAARLPYTTAVQRDFEWGAAIAPVGNRLLLAAGPAGVLTLAHAADGEGGAVVEAGALPVLGAPQGVALADGHAIVSDADSELWVLDVRDPAAPKVVGRADLIHPIPGALVDSRGGKTVVRDGLAYVAREVFHFQPGGLHVFDVRNPARPRQVGLWDPYVQQRLDPAYDSWGGITGLRSPEIAGDRLWLSGYPALTELDVADPASPRFVRHGYVPGDDSSWYGLDAGGVAADGGRLFVAAYDSGVYAADIASPGEIKLIGHAEMPGFASDVAVVGQHVLVVGYGRLGLRVLDADTLDAVRSVENLQAGGIEVVGDTAYVLAMAGVKAYDVADPRLPVLRGAYDVPLDPDFAQMAVEGSLMAIAGSAHGLELVRLTAGEGLPVPTAGPTLTPWPTSTPGTEPPRITPLPTSTPHGTVAAATPGPGGTATPESGGTATPMTMPTAPGITWTPASTPESGGTATPMTMPTAPGTTATPASTSVPGATGSAETTPGGATPAPSGTTTLSPTSDRPTPATPAATRRMQGGGRVFLPAVTP